MRLKNFIIPILAVLFLCLGCSSNDTSVIDVELSYEELCDGQSLETLDPDELYYIKTLLTVDQEMDALWSDFKILRAYPIYIMTDSTQGIFFNPPPSAINNSTEICSEIAGYEKLSLFRNEALHDFTKSKLDGDAFYNFTTYDDFDIYLYDLTNSPDYFYTQYKDRNGYFDTSVFFHEFFHVYQLRITYELQFGDYYDQIPGFNQFPLNEETLPLLLLLFDTMIDAYQQTSPSQKLQYLKYYVSIIHSINDTDISNNEIEKYISFYEKLEGTARYIEVFGTLNSLNNNTIDDPTHGYETYAQNLESGNSIPVRQLYGRRMFYHTGAGAIKLLEELTELNLDLEFLTPKNSPYTISKSILNLDEEDLNQALEEVKELYHWDELVTRSTYLLN